MGEGEKEKEEEEVRIDESLFGSLIKGFENRFKACKIEVM